MYLYKLKNTIKITKDITKDINTIEVIKAINKYIVCYPYGGFCDMLHVIDDCLNYAIKYNRILIIDTTNNWFKEDIYNYMTFTHENMTNKLNYSLQFNMDVKNNIQYSMNQNPYCNNSIDLSIEYTEDIIYYNNCGGGIPYTLLNYFHFNPIIIDSYRTRLNALPKNYTSMHIRNTDIKSDVDNFISTHQYNLKNNSCFIATDDIVTRDKIKQLYGSNIYFFSNIPKLKGANIHYNHENIDHKQFIIDCIVDILLLASANNFYYSSYSSGYSRLALYLFENKEILNKILNIQ